MGQGAAPAGVGSSPAPIVAPTVSSAAPQQPQFNSFMQAYGQNNIPQQQAFNRPQPPQSQQLELMPQNRGGYDRQLDQLRGQGQYGQQGSQAALINNFLRSQSQLPASGQPSAPVGGKGGGSSPTGRY